MINAIRLPGLRNGEYSQFLAFILKIVLDAGPMALNVQAQYDALYAAYQFIEALFKQGKGSIITDELVALDTLRDRALIGITNIIRGNTYSSKAGHKQAAELLEHHLGIFGTDIANDNLLSETATLRNIVNDWATKPDLAAALTLLDLDYWKTDLDTANNQFETTYLARSKEQGSASPDTIRAKRLETNQLYYDLRDEIEAWNTIKKGAEPYGSTIQSVNGVINNYNDLLARRGAGKPGYTGEATAPAA